MFKKIIYTFLFGLLVFFIVNLDFSRQIIKYLIPTEFRYKIKEFVFTKEVLNSIKFYHQVNYNEKKIPEIFFQTLSIKYLDLADVVLKPTSTHYKNNPNMRTAFIEDLESSIFLITSYGETSKIEYFENKKIVKLIDNNINKIFYQTKYNIKIVGSLLQDNYLYVSLYQVDKKNENNSSVCSKFSIIRAPIDQESKNLKFDIIFNSKSCDGSGQPGGEIAIDKKNNKLYFSTGTTDRDGGYLKLSQDDKSIYGKIIQLDLNNFNYKIFSKGHRNPQGLVFTKNGYLISTEHGPYGGDEINKIVKNGNYGWPVSSYGEHYGYPNESANEYQLKKNHSKFKFMEPIFAFVPSIGISKIIEVPKNFSNLMQNNFLITSLNRRSIYRVNFDEGFNKLLFMEEIRVGGRVRDIVFFKKTNSFVLYLEDIASLMIISAK